MMEGGMVWTQISTALRSGEREPSADIGNTSVKNLFLFLFILVVRFLPCSVYRKLNLVVILQCFSFCVCFKKS